MLKERDILDDLGFIWGDDLKYLVKNCGVRMELISFGQRQDVIINCSRKTLLMELGSIFRCHKVKIISSKIIESVHNR
jgi:hypothetical protein